MIITVEIKNFYDENGFPISDPNITEGYDINGFPTMRYKTVVIDVDKKLEEQL